MPFGKIVVAAVRPDYDNRPRRSPCGLRLWQRQPTHESIPLLDFLRLAHQRLTIGGYTRAARDDWWETIWRTAKLMELQDLFLTGPCRTNQTRQH
jgi:hypothetical protein